MDWTLAIDRNREALKRVLAALLAMAGLTDGNRQEQVADRLCPTADCPRPIAATLPRHLHRAVLRLLRPAEAAVRRLVIVAARGLVVTLSPVRPRRPAAKKPSVVVAAPPPLTPPHKGEGNSATLTTPSPLWGGVRGGGVPRLAVPNHTRKPAIGFRLFDPPSRWGRARKRIRQVCVPRISFPGLTALSPIRKPPMPFDPIDTTPLAHRLAALARALDDLPKQAQRFARWTARRDAELDRRRQEASQSALAGRAASTRIRRVWPLRPGRPPGQRPKRDRRAAHEVHDILDTVHGLAIWALEPADTS